MPRGMIRRAPRATQRPSARPEPPTPVVVASGGGAGCVRFYCTTVGGEYGIVRTIDGMHDAPVDGTYRTPREAVTACDVLNERPMP